MAELVLIRGWPGSGKTTKAKTEYPNHKHFEADMFMVDRETGLYAFDFKRLDYCHKRCLESARKELEKGNDVVVSNTFRCMWELAPYLELEFDSLKIVQCKGMYQNVHGCPQEKVDFMRNHWEKLNLSCC